MKWINKIFLDEQVIIYVIILNAIVLFVMGFPSLENSMVLEGVDLVFTIFFALEAFFKIRMYGWYLYIRNSWNKFDFFLVAISFPSLFAFLAFVPDVSFLLVFRLLRILRILRFLKFIPNIKEMFAGIQRAFRASLFILIVLFIYNLLLAVLSTFLFAATSPQLFGNPLLSLFSIFQIFTVEGWNDIPREMISQLPPDSWLDGFIRAYFVIVVLSGGIFGFSIVNAIFVDEMVKDNNNDLEAKVEELNRKMDLLLKAQKKDN